MRVTFDLPKYSNHYLVDGAFDPLHAGHIAYLQAAASLSKAPLLCAVASDEQIRAKGKIPLLPQESRVATVEALGCVAAVHAKQGPTEDVLRQMRPFAYVKGWDWRDRLPSEQLEVCRALEIPIVYLETPSDSSTARLRAWALADADASLDRLETYLHAQQATPPERYDKDYFQGLWRADGGSYTLDARRKAEGRHPKIIKELWEGKTILDAGCGPGYLVQMLRELGMDAAGFDTSKEAVKLSPLPSSRICCCTAEDVPDKVADVVICREVLEHMTVQDVHWMVCNLFRSAREAVYITTRFQSDRSVFDVTDERDVDPTHISLLSQSFLRALCVLNGGVRDREAERKLDHLGKGRVLVYAL